MIVASKENWATLRQIIELQEKVEYLESETKELKDRLKRAEQLYLGCENYINKLMNESRIIYD